MPKMYIDTESKIIKTEQFMQGCVKSTYYVISENILEEKDTFVKPVPGDGSEWVEFSHNGDEITESELNEQVGIYGNYGFKSYEELKVSFNDENLSQYVQ